MFRKLSHVLENFLINLQLFRVHESIPSNSYGMKEKWRCMFDNLSFQKEKMLQQLSFFKRKLKRKKALVKTLKIIIFVRTIRDENEKKLDYTLYTYNQPIGPIYSSLLNGHKTSNPNWLIHVPKLRVVITLFQSTY